MKIQIIIKSFLALVAVAFFLSCQSVQPHNGTKTTAILLGQIVPRQTSREQVHHLLGAPHSPGILTEVWEFKKGDGKMAVVEISYCKDMVTAKRSYNLPDR